MRPTSLRLRAVWNFCTSIIIGKITLSGKENIETVLSNKKRLILVSSHISNLDMLAAVRVLAPLVDLKVVNKSPHHAPLYRPIENIVMTAAGYENFLSLSYNIPEEKLSSLLVPSSDRPLFAPADYLPMKKALEAGGAVLIAAHNQTFSWKLPSLAGYGAVYLSEITPNSVILPVSVEVKTDTPAGVTEIASDGTLLQKMNIFFKRPAMHVHIHEAITVPPLPAVNRFAELAERQSTLSNVEHEEYKNLRETRRAVGNKIMKILASSLSPAKRGRWQ